MKYTLTNKNGTRTFESREEAIATARREYGTYEVRDEAGKLVEAQW